MRYVDAIEEEVIPLGRQGENEVEIVKFDVSNWKHKYGNGIYTLLHERCMDTAPYECPITVADGIVSWGVRNSDTAYVGKGRAQLVYIVEDKVAKSAIYYTLTLASIDGNVELPDPYNDWLCQIHDDAEYVKSNIDITRQYVTQAEAYVGSPLVAVSYSEMSDHNKVYVYTGSESGMVNGHWYYYNGTTWEDGGVYNSVAADVATNDDIDSAIYS